MTTLSLWLFGGSILALSIESFIASLLLFAGAVWLLLV